MNWRRRIGLLAGMVAGLARGADVELVGRVVNVNHAPVSSARVSLERAATTADDTFRVQVTADQGGAFAIQPPGPGEYLVSIDRDGYFQLRRQAVVLTEGATEATFVLNPLREVFESVNVTAPPPAVDLDRTSAEQTLSGNEILFIPYTTTNNLRNAISLLPGVVQDARGGIHVDGGSEEQVMYTLDGFNVGDPLTGKFESRLSVESVNAVEVSRGRYSAEYGKGSAGAMAVKTATGDDRLRYSATNFFPGVENHKGLLIGNWTPRFNLSGPIRRSRAWFSDSLDARYDRQVVEELPAGKDRTWSWRYSNLLRNQINLTPSNILYTGFLINYWMAPRTGLSLLDPLETTVDRRSRQWFVHAKNQKYFTRGALLEAGFALNRTFGREIPQGHNLYVLTPDGRRGNSFLDAARKGSRDQVLANAFLPAFSFAGQHQLKTGGDINRVGYWQDARRTGYENYRSSGVLQRRVFFGGVGRFGRSNFESAAYVQDAWRLRPSLLLELGLRADRDQILHHTAISPRFGIAWGPDRSGNTKISGGYAVIHDATHLRLFTRPLDQYSLTTHFAPGGQIARGPALGIYQINGTRFRSPRYQTWSAGFERRLPANIYARVSYLRKRGVDGFTYANVIDESTATPAWIAQYAAQKLDAVYQLGNGRRDVYDAVEFTLRQTFGKQYEWMVSYTRSRAFSNAVVDVNVDDPLIITNNVGPMPWDAPDRVMSWGFLPFFRENYGLAYMLQYRTGFPFSVVDDDGRQLGDLNSYRYPKYLEVNLHIERRFVFRGHRWALRVGSNNITSRKNPTGVNNNASSPAFLTYYGVRGRTFNFRFRWLGKAKD